MMRKASLIIFSTDKGLSRERQTFVLGMMDAALSVSPIFRRTKRTVISFFMLSDPKHDMD